MTIESLFGITGDNLIFKETFNSEFFTRKIGGTPTDVQYENGVGEFNGTSSKIVYQKSLSGAYTVRIRFKSLIVALNDLLVDFRNNDTSGTGYIVATAGGTGFFPSSGTGYVNGAAGLVLAAGSNEIVVTGINIESFETYFMTRHTSTSYSEGDVDLFEIYEGTWTAEQVKNAYNGVTYRALPSNEEYQEVLSIDSRKGTISDKYDNTVTNNNVEIKKDGSVYTQRYNGTDAYLNIDSLVSRLSNTTTGTWMCWVKPFASTPSTNEIIISFGDTNDDEYMVLYQDTAGKLGFVSRVAGGTKWALIVDSANFVGGRACHVGIVQNGTEPVLYVNGVAVAQTFTGTVDKTVWFADSTGLDNGRIGNMNFDGGGEQFHLDGKLSQPKIIDGVYSADEVMQVYTNERSKYL